MTKDNDNFIILHQTVQKQHSDHMLGLKRRITEEDKSFGFHKKANT